MQNRLNSFLDCIRAENGLIEDLVVSALNKKTAIIGGNLESLNELMRQEIGMVQALEKLEAERLRKQNDLSQRMGIEENLTANELIGLMQEAGIESWFEVSSLIGELSWNVQRLMEHNAMNSGLLEQSLAFIENMETLITRQRDTTYSVGGAIKEIKARSMVDKTV